MLCIWPFFYNIFSTHHIASLEEQCVTLGLHTMSAPSPHHTLKQRSGGIMAIYRVILLLIFHSYVVMYINSSFIEQFIGNQGVGAIYIIGSALTVLIFLFISQVLRKYGNYRITMLLIALNGAAVLGMSAARSLETALPLFFIHIITLPLILFNLDVFLEELIGNKEGTTGSRRGLLLALSSFIGAVSPLLSGLIVDIGSFSAAYLLSAFTLIPVVMILTFHFRNFQDPKYSEIHLMSAIHSFWINYNIRFVFLAHLLLQVFFCFMVVYAPLYLATKIGLSWSEIGIILFAGQLAYVFFEYPIGFIADRYLGEKEMMAAGFLILAISTSWLSVISTALILPWIIIMFATRVGASLVEVTTETYFFKHTKSTDAQIISFFRITRPLSYVFGAALGGISLLYLPFNLMFVVFGFLMIAGIFFAASIRDTK